MSSLRLAASFRLVWVLVVCSTSTACEGVRTPPEMPVAAAPTAPTTTPALPPAAASRFAFARYLNMMHNRVHPLFSEELLKVQGAAQGTPRIPAPGEIGVGSGGHTATFEIVVDQDTGKLVTTRIVKASGERGYDAAALRAFELAQPFGPAPAGLALPNGRVHIRWEFVHDAARVDDCSLTHARFLTAAEVSPDAPPSVADGDGGAPPRAETPPAGDENGRPIGLLGGSSWSCPFPAQADTDKIDQALVGLRVTVTPDGTPSDVAIIADPGHGFGHAARACALASRYRPALDRRGVPIPASTVINIRFAR